MSNLLPIGDIMPDMKNWSCIITVQEKQQVTDSMGTPTKKQKFVFYDSESSKVEGIIFNIDIPRMSPMLQVYKKYKISNADIRSIPPKFQSLGLTKQWVITSKTVIEEVNGNEDIMPVKFSFTKFANLAEYMDDRSKSVALNHSHPDFYVNVRSQTILLSLWDDFLNNEGQVLLNNMQSSAVIIGRKLKVSNYNGVAFSTWAMRNTKLIAEIIDAKSYIKYNPVLSLKTDQKTTLICNVIPSQKTAWVKAKLFFEHIFQKYWYMSCAKCYRAAAVDHGIEFTYNSCKEKGPAMPRCRFDVDLSDDNRVIPASIFGDLAENILTFTAIEAMDHFDQIKTKTFLVHINPVQTQLADARQRYTILYCSELEPEFGRAQLTGDGGFGSKVHLRLCQKFDEAETVDSNDFESSDANSKKKAKLG
ncbi:replication protein A 70 kDa DNA-binding subunit D-like [Coffea arabica]|uniref:Replication protein A 70 kDa DNA-binding subunit D-like n=1 Tax=Coffea arabica TaxID=13443 RepID=A0ABM4VHB5_COFAR